MKACDAVNKQDHGRENGRRGQAAVGLVSGQCLRAAPVVLLAAIVLASPAQAQDCSAGRDLIAIPEIRSEAQKLKAVLMLSDEVRSMWVRAAKPAGLKPGESGIGFNDATPFTAGRKVTRKRNDGTDVQVDVGRCMQQRLRYLTGWKVADWINALDRPSEPSTGEPIPGPTFRARIGDLVQISFRNQVDTKNFPKTLDRGDCDVATGTLPDPKEPTKTIKVNVYPRNNTMPNCLHGSSTSNVHFHGTHTTPGTTGDNVLISVRPALRVKGKDPSGIDYPPIQPTDAVVKSNFAEIFKHCEENGSPTEWERRTKDLLPGKDIPATWREEQKRLLKLYDATAPYKGVNASLPPGLHLWPKNEKDINEGRWPQYSVGAFPYCFRLPDYATAEPKVNMGQAPGTHWYHAHVHGSTALNVANGLVGAFIIEGPYDDKLQVFYYKQKHPDTPLEGQELVEKAREEKVLQEKVLVIQQLSTSLGLLSAGRTGPPFLSVNGRLVPVIKMKPGEVQMWRIVNGAYRSFVQFREFVPQTTTLQAATPCSNTEAPCVDWRQTAQDGVQFAPDNYEKVGIVNAQFNMAGGNRVDLLVKAPSTKGSYKLQVKESTSEVPAGLRARDVTLLTVEVDGDDTPMGFIDKESFPEFPDFLKDIPAEAPAKKRPVVYDTKLGSPPPTVSPLRGALTDADPVLPMHTIDHKPFDAKAISQSMVLNSVEEWTVSNEAVGIAHPFHIHINPFQVVEVFDPDSPEAKDSTNTECYVDPRRPDTWKPCNALQPKSPFVWWDVRAIPAARQDTLDCTEPESPGTWVCASAGGSACSPNTDTPPKQQCTVKIPGYFKMRSRFVDFPGVYVQHCHILAHEDVGMMQFVEVCPAGGPCPTRTPSPEH